jgi:hypothetical protein
MEDLVCLSCRIIVGVSVYPSTGVACGLLIVIAELWFPWVSRRAVHAGM